MKLKHRQFSFEMKAIGKDGTFTGYGSVFGNTDLYGDVVMPGAFQKTLAAWKQKGRLPPILWQHNSAQPIGPFTTMVEDAKGLYVEGQLLVNDVQQAREAHALMETKAISGMSIGYNVPAGGELFDPNAKVNKLNEVELWECSIVTFPANTEALIQTVKSIEHATFDEVERAIRSIFPATPRRLATKIAGACFDALDGKEPPESECDSASVAAVKAALARTIQNLKSPR